MRILVDFVEMKLKLEQDELIFGKRKIEDDLYYLDKKSKFIKVLIYF